MNNKKEILAIVGSTRVDSLNLRLVNAVAELSAEYLAFNIFDKLSQLSHFNPDEVDSPPKEIVDFFRQIEESDGVLICTPEYVFSLPGSLKNALEWTVATTLFTDKPTALITASASGEKAHEQLELIMRTLGANFNEQTQLLINGVKGKVEGETIKDKDTLIAVEKLIKSLIELLGA